MSDIIRCSSCSTTVDLERNDHSADGWIVVPRKQAACPECIANAMAMRDVRVEESRLNGRVMRTFKVNTSKAVR